MREYKIIVNNIKQLILSGKTADLVEYRKALTKPGTLSPFELAAIEQAVKDWQAKRNFAELAWH